MEGVRDPLLSYQDLRKRPHLPASPCSPNNKLALDTGSPPHTHRTQHSPFTLLPHRYTDTQPDKPSLVHTNAHTPRHNKVHTHTTDMDRHPDTGTSPSPPTLLPHTHMNCEENRGCPAPAWPLGLPFYKTLFIKTILTQSLFPSESRFQGHFQISLIALLVH